MSIRAINHVQIAAPPELEAKAVAFYRNTLGLKQIPKAEGTESPKGAWFSAGNIELHVGIQEKGFVAARKAHVAFIVENLDAWRRKLSAANIKEGGDLAGYRRFFAEDPCGNRLEFMEAIVD